MEKDARVVCPGSDRRGDDRGGGEARIKGLLVRVLGDGRGMMDDRGAVPSG